MHSSRGLKSRNDHFDDEQGKLNELLDKVNALKSITIEIGNEAVEQNQYLDSMQNEFSRLTVSLSDQIAGVLGLQNRHGDARYFFGTVLLVVMVLVLLWLWVI